MRQTIRVLSCITALVVSGCHSHDVHFEPSGPMQPFGQQIEYTDVCDNGSLVDVGNLTPPPSARHPMESERLPMTLEDAIREALQNSQVIRSLGAQVASSVPGSRTVFDPAIQEASPANGVEAALAAFDSQFTTHLFSEHTERQFNSFFFGGGANGLQSQLGDFQLGVNKTAATGTQFTLENVSNYNRNNSPANLFPSTYDTVFQGRFRHPLAQGSGVDFNRIAGPNATPGNYNGVVLARINTDVSLADFEAAVQNLVRDVESTYWELYFAYRDLSVKTEGRDLSLESWRLEKNRLDVGTRTPDQEAFARQQYYLSKVNVENALSGTASGLGGVYTVERRLRRLLGLPTSDGRIIMPTTDPVDADLVFDWHDSLASALTRRVELRRQQWTIKRRELELVAARNFTRMRVDLLGEYRYRGFGDHLFGDTNIPSGSAFESLFTGDLQEWRAGVDIQTPVGNRLGHAAVRHAELQLAREHAIYDDTELQVASELHGTFTELDRAYVVTRSQYNRRIATLIRLEAERERNRGGKAALNLVLDAQQQAVDAESNYYRALVDYNLAIMNMHYSRGTLLDRHGITLAEGPWSPDAQQSAAKMSRRFAPALMDYGMVRPGPVSRGAFPQRLPSVQTVEGAIPQDVSTQGVPALNNSPLNDPAPAPPEDAAPAIERATPLPPMESTESNGSAAATPTRRLPGQSILARLPATGPHPVRTRAPR